MPHILTSRTIKPKIVSFPLHWICFTCVHRIHE